MVFLGIYRALYDYVPQGDNEIALTEGDILMVLEKSADDDWWKAKKKGHDGEEEEPEGLIPNNYIEEVCRKHTLSVPPPRSAIDASLGRSRLASQSSLRLHTPDRRRAVIPGRRRARRIRCLRP